MTKMQYWILKTSSKFDDIENVALRRTLLILLVPVLFIVGIVAGAIMGVLLVFDQVIQPAWSKYGEADIPDEDFGV